MTENQARQRVIAAMCPERVCRVCGEPSRRITEREVYFVSTGQPTRGHTMRNDMGPLGHDGAVASRVLSESWSDCGHDDWRPGVVLDPFQNQEGVMLTLGNIDE